MSYRIGSIGTNNHIGLGLDLRQRITDSHGKIQPLVEANVWPERFDMQAVLLCVAGFMVIYGIELAARAIVRKRE